MNGYLTKEEFLDVKQFDKEQMYEKIALCASLDGLESLKDLCESFATKMNVN